MPDEGNASPPTGDAAPPPRRIVLCLDGTWNSTYTRKHRDDGHEVLKPSNVLKLARAVLPCAADGRQQLTYYDTGVGSLARYPGISNRLLSVADKILGGAWGAGFEGNIEDALGFLSLNHRPGDQVFVFGFSRGACTARGLTRFLDWAGGLPVKRDAYYLPLIFRDYIVARGTRSYPEVLAEIDARRVAEGREALKLEPFQPVNVELLGVWDSVMALGARFRAAGASTATASRSFHVGAEPARCVRHARQALAIDEVRYDFRPAIWTGCAADQTLEQRWFAGVHSNVGGGYVDDGLANLALRWILGEAKALGLDVDDRFIGNYSGFAMDRLYRSEAFHYRVLDALRNRVGRGRRRLVGQPAGANLTLDPSVIHRLAADPGERKDDGALRFPDLRQRYRPANLFALLARHKEDLDGYLAGLGLREELRQLPDDVLERVRRSSA